MCGLENMYGLGSLEISYWQLLVGDYIPTSPLQASLALAKLHLAWGRRVAPPGLYGFLC
jgi:hypothetical protein